MNFPGRHRILGRYGRGVRAVILATNVILLLDPAAPWVERATAAKRICRRTCGPECINGCRSDRRDCVNECTDDFAEGVNLDPTCGPCVDDAFAAWADCRDGIKGPDGDVQACISGCPAIARHCTLTKECIAGCRAMIPALMAECKQRLKSSLRECDNGLFCLLDARLNRRMCNKACRQDAAGCISDCRHDFPDCVATCSAVAPRPAGACNCQRRCVENMVSFCYADCAAACGGPGQALGLCQRACRNEVCDRIEAACTGDGTGTSAYDRCCEQCDNCEEELSDELACVQETTTTSTTRATTTSTGTTTTTLQ